MRQTAIFLNGAYPTAHLDFYGTAIDFAKGSGLVIAVDGALHLFHQLGKEPHLMIGDFDSVNRRVLDDLHHISRIQYPTDKDATDGELAVRYALNQGYDQLDIFGAFDTSFESDQMLANVFLLALISERRQIGGYSPAAKLVDHRQEVYFLDDSDLDLTGTPGDLLSIIPISCSARVTLRGTKWELTDELTQLGSTRTLRNCLAREQVKIAVAGMAVIVHRRSGDR